MLSSSYDSKMIKKVNVLIRYFNNLIEKHNGICQEFYHYVPFLRSVNIDSDRAYDNLLKAIVCIKSLYNRMVTYNLHKGNLTFFNKTVEMLKYIEVKYPIFFDKIEGLHARDYFF